jgi:hypothetical protein
MLPLIEVQTAIYTVLVPVLAPVPVFDAGSRHDFSYPYVIVGAETGGGTSDTLTEQGVDVLATVHVWSRQPGMKETFALMAKVKDAIHDQRLPLANGVQWVGAKLDLFDSFPDLDGVSRHGFLKFRVFTFK